MAIVCIGEIVVDWLCFTPGATFFTATDWYRAMGGNTANVSIGLSRLGSQSRLVAKIGADVHGAYLKQMLGQEQVDCSYIVTDTQVPTAQCYMLTTSTGEHRYHNWPTPHAADMLTVDEIDFDRAFDGAKAIHGTTISLEADPRRTAVLQAFKLAKQKDMVVSFDAGFATNAPDSVQCAGETAMGLADLVKMNEFELECWSGRLLPTNMLADSQPGNRTIEELTEAATALFQHLKPAALLLTLSSRGSLVISAQGAVYCAPYEVEAVSEVGAGDAYVAGLLHALTDRLGVSKASSLSKLTRDDWREAGMSGNIAGAFAATHSSAYGGMPTRDEFASAAVKRLKPSAKD